MLGFAVEQTGEPDEFKTRREIGRAAEKRVSNHLQSEGWFVVPSYDYTGSDGEKAPRMYGASRSYIIPDLDVSRGAGKKGLPPPSRSDFI